MTAGDVRPHSRGTKCPSFASTSSLRNQEGAGNAGCRTHPQPCVQNGRKHARKSRQVRRTCRHSLRNGLRLIARSPRCPGFLATVPRALDPGLIPASGDRDHTISPSASVRFVAAHSHVHRSPHPTLVTIRSVPLDEARDGRMTSAFFTSEKEKYFLRRGLTRIREISSSGKSVRRIFLELQEVVGLNQLATAIVDARVVEKSSPPAFGTRTVRPCLRHLMCY
jgi:hypothetical protein